MVAFAVFIVVAVFNVVNILVIVLLESSFCNVAIIFTVFVFQSYLRLCSLR